MTTKECQHVWEWIEDQDGSGRPCGYFQCLECDETAYTEDMDDEPTNYHPKLDGLNLTTRKYYDWK